MSNFANKVTSAAPCHTVFVRTKRKRFAYVKAGNGQDRVSCVVGGGVRCSLQGVGGDGLPIPQPVWRFGTLRQALQRDAHAIGRREHPDLAGILPKEGRKPMTLYHGSTVDIPHVDLAKSKPNKDFGRAFYLSDDEQQALEMAQFRAEFEDSTPIVNVYEFDEALFEEFQIKRFQDYTEEWAHFVYDHRTEPNGRTLHDYDIVYGPIANDRIGAQITRYKQGYISFEEFLKRIQYIKGITFQYAFCTQRAIDKLIKQTSR